MLLFTLIYVDVIVIVTNVIVTLLSTLNNFFSLLLLLSRNSSLQMDSHHEVAYHFLRDRYQSTLACKFNIAAQYVNISSQNL